MLEPAFDPTSGFIHKVVHEFVHTSRTGYDVGVYSLGRRALNRVDGAYYADLCHICAMGNRRKVASA